MKATELILAIATSAIISHAHAESFRVQGAVDMGGLGGNGDMLFGDFADPGDPLNPVVPPEFGPTFNGTAPMQIGTMTPTSYSGVYFWAGGVASIVAPSGGDGVEIFRGGFGADYSLAGVIRVLIRDADNADVNIEFTGLNTDATVVGFISGDGVLDQRYQLRQYDAGFRSLWVEAIPAPGVAGVFGLVGCLAVRRRRGDGARW